MHTVKSTLFSMAIVVIGSINVQAQTDSKISEIGSSITKQTAQNWIQNFKTKHVNEITGHFYGKDMISKLLSTPQAEGIYIFNGLDGDGNIHLIFKAVDNEGKVIQNGIAYDNGLTCPPYCHPKDDQLSAAGQQIAEGLAQQWIQNFQANSNGRILSHLYGKDILNELVSKESTNGIFFAYGLDVMGFEHLVLTGVTKEGELAWDPPANNGLTCPPYCEESYPVVGVAKN